MALVAYDYSDASNSENEDDITNTVVTNMKEPTHEKPEVKPTIKLNEEEYEQEKTSNNHTLFNLLPQPTKKKPAVIEDDDEFLHKKVNTDSVVKPKARITVPSLKEFKDVKGTIANSKPKVADGKISSLLSILPQPRNAVPTSTTTKSFVPHVLTRKPKTTPKKKDSLLNKKAKTEVKSLAKDYSDDSDNDDDLNNDFFSINKTEDITIEDMPLDIDVTPAMTVATPCITNTKKGVHNIQSYFKKEDEDQTVQSNVNESIAGDQSEYSEEASSSNQLALDDEAILKLCGTRGKRKREEIQIVDVNQKEVLADAREWLLKGLMDDTTKRVSSSKRRGDEPTSQQRRKHQITYLAHQAKANEAELQNQWANNRQSKRQTQSKYGF